MANRYKNAFFDPISTNTETIYTTPNDCRSIIQNIQITNETGSKDVKVYVYDASANVDYLVAHGSISGPTICNFAKGPIVLEESDVLKAQSSVTSNVPAIVSILETDRNQQ